MQQLPQGVVAQQRQFSRLRAFHDGLVVRGLCRHLHQTLLELVDFSAEVVLLEVFHAFQPARAAARTSKYALPRFIRAENSAAFFVRTVLTKRSTAFCRANSD